MNVLITGATGFVGRALVVELLRRDYEVGVGVRKPADGLPGEVRQHVVGDLLPDTDWSDALAGVNTVVHLAARVHVMNEESSDPLSEFREVNVVGTERLARMAAKSGVRRFIYLSSVKVNGEGGNVPYAENDTPASEDRYGVSKWEAEQVLLKVAEETGLEVVILRPPLVYGPGVKANFLLMIDLVNRGIPLPLTSINNRRSFIYLGNLVDAIATCVNHPEAIGQTYLVSDGEDVSTPELIRRVAAALSRPVRLFPFPPSLMRFAGKLIGKSDAVERLVSSLTINSSKIRRELGWQPPYTMEEGLKETAGWWLTQSRTKSRGSKRRCKEEPFLAP